MHDIEFQHPDRETWTATCSCGRWRSRFTLDDVPIGQAGDLLTIAKAELRWRHKAHVEEVAGHRL